MAIPAFFGSPFNGRASIAVEKTKPLRALSVLLSSSSRSSEIAFREME